MQQPQAQPLVLDDSRLVEVALQRGFLTGAQLEHVKQRQADLRQGGIHLTLGQLMLERRVLTLPQLKQLMQAVELRGSDEAATRPMASAKEQVDTKFGDYQLLEVLADTARYRMFRAKDEPLNKIVALKVFPPAIIKDAVWYERLKREVVMARVLSHPNIIATHGTTMIDGCVVMIQEHVDGLTLAERLAREGNFPEKTTWLMAREIGKALAYAAQIGIIHRDIKPENIVCSREGLVKIVDMGLSKSLGDESGLTAAGTTVGTPFYISPEQARGLKTIDGRTDIYSLGCTVFHMLTGSVPFMGDVLTDVMLAHTKAPRPDPREILPEISSGSAKLVMRMMAISPDDRPADAEALVGDIDALLQGLADPDAVLRPVQMVAPSRVSAVVPRRPYGDSQPRMPAVQAPAPAPLAKSAAAVPPSAKQMAQRLPRPSLITRFMDWLINLFN